MMLEKICLGSAEFLWIMISMGTIIMKIFDIEILDTDHLYGKIGMLLFTCASWTNIIATIILIINKLFN